MPSVPFIVGGLLWLFRGEILAIIAVALAWHFRWFLLCGLGLVVGSSFPCGCWSHFLNGQTAKRQTRRKPVLWPPRPHAERPTTARTRIEPIPPAVKLDPVIADYEARKAAYFRGEGPPP